LAASRADLRAACPLLRSAGMNNGNFPRFVRFARKLTLTSGLTVTFSSFAGCTSNSDSKTDAQPIADARNWDATGVYAPPDMALSGADAGTDGGGVQDTAPAQTGDGASADATDAAVFVVTGVKVAPADGGVK